MFTLFFQTLFFLCIIIPSFNISAQEQELVFKKISVDEGLSQSKINCIHQDSRGFMWFGTLEGLNKYDGYEFSIFQEDNNVPGNLSGNFIQCIFNDSRDNLWIGTESGGLNLFNRNSNQFIHFTNDTTSAIKISSNDVNVILEDSRGNLWLGTGNGLNLFDLKNKSAINYLPNISDDFSPGENNINALFEDTQNNFWIGTSEYGLCLFDRNTNTFTCFQHNPQDKFSISDNDIRSIYEDNLGNLWIGTYNGGFNLFDRVKKIFYRFAPDPTTKESLTAKAILDYDEDNLWIGTRNGLYLFNKNTHKFIRYAHDPHNPSSLSQNNVQAIYKDLKGDFWFGTKDGIDFLNTTIIPFIHYRADEYNNKCLNHKSVATIFEDSRGDLWLGTVEGGLNRLDRKTGIFKYYTHNPNDPNSISSSNINAIAEDKNGDLWVGTHQGGLNFYNRKTNRFYHFMPEPNETNSLILNSIHSLFIDRDDDIWAGNNLLFRFDKKKKTFIPFPINFQGPFTWYIQSIIQDKNGTIWVGGPDNKLYSIDKSTLKYDFYQLPGNSKENRINIILEDRDQNLWLGTFQGGLYSFDKKHKTFQLFTQKDGLPSNHICSIQEDNLGNLWISTIKGLSKFNPETKIFKNYFKENGLQSNLFNYASCKTRSGEMFFGGINGVTAFYPEKIRDNSYIPPVYITDFKISNHTVKIGGQNPILTKPISETQKIKLSYKHSVFSFTFAALNYATSEQNEYKYKMEGFDTDWNNVGTMRFASYTNLNPGKYTFKVKASNNDGLWNEKGASIHITITPPFWRTLWFKFIVAGIIALIIRHFIIYQRQKRNLLKTTALANITQLKLLRNQMNPHFLLNTLSSIRALVNIDKNQAWQMISELSEFFRYSLLNYNKVEASLEDEINAAKNYISIQKVCFHDYLQVSFQIDKPARECIVPAFILQPLIENAIKHGKPTGTEKFEIKIKTLYDNGILSIDVSNTGNIKKSQDSTLKDKEIHGTSLVNIKKRLEIMFSDHFSFQIFEDNGWVHSKIRINYEMKNSEKQFYLNVEELSQQK
ncbi:histidine kinase [candidate division KSB1 bacterium]|nr:histidine kinase [candidate division KSB1 bacterium]